MSAGAAIDRRAVSLTHIRPSAGSYDLDGRYIPGTDIVTAISGVIQPASGNQLKDLPEGIRTEAQWLVWSRSEISVDDHLTYGSVSYRVVYAWPRAEGGFYRAALGRSTK